MTVRTADGDDVGIIETIEGNTARVKPEQSLSDSIRERLGWKSEDQAVYELPHSEVESFDDDAVNLNN